MSKVEALAPGPAPRTANWRAQLPTLIRVYGIVLDPAVAADRGHDRQSGVYFATERLQHGIAMGARGDHGGGHDVRDSHRRFRSVGGVGVLALRCGRGLCRANSRAVGRVRRGDRGRPAVRACERHAGRGGSHQSLHHDGRQRLHHQWRGAGHDPERRLSRRQ